MFRIECFVDDKLLAKVKWALFELGAYNVIDQPVKDSKPNGTRRTAKDEIPQAFLAYAKQHKLKAVRAKEIKEFVESVGYSVKSYSLVMGFLKEAGIISKQAGGGTSNVTWTIKRANRLAKKRATA